MDTRLKPLSWPFHTAFLYRSPIVLYKTTGLKKIKVTLLGFCCSEEDSTHVGLFTA